MAALPIQLDCQKESAGCPDLFGDPRRHRKRTARLGRAEDDYLSELRRFTRARVRPRAASDVGVVQATSPAAGTIALRDQAQWTTAAGGLSSAVGIGAI